MVGAMVKEDGVERGLAHFVEHMAFNGTSHFAKQDLVKFMESIGMRFGPSLNAFTSFDETVYMLTIPTDKPEVIATAFLILEDWAHNLSFDPAEVDKERGVIVEEWRLGRGAYARMQDKQFPVLLRGSRYAERLPIGDKQVIETFGHESLKRFYADWYRPDLMAVIAVGDLDPSAVEGLIKQHFAGLTGPANPRPRARFDVPDHEETLFAIATDPEASTTNVSVYSKLPLRDPTTAGAYREGVIEQLAGGMLNRRFSELAQKPDPPFLYAFSGRGGFVRTKEVATLGAMVKEDGIERGLDALLSESARASRFGFTPTELARQKQDVLRSMEQLYAEKEKQESADFASEYSRNFLQREPIPGIAYEYELFRRFIPEITLEEVNGLWQARAREGSRVVLVSAPAKPGLAVPDEAKLAAVMQAAAAKEIKPYEDTIAGQALLDKMPQPGRVVKVRTRPEFGITEWTLANGVRVVLRPTQFQEDEIVFRALSPGGTSLASDKDYVPASTAGQVIPAGGLGRFSAIDLRKVLSGKIASVRPYISSMEEGLSGNASPKDLETMFQLIYLTFTQPRADATIFGILTSQMKAMLANRKASPEYAFSEAFMTTLAGNHYRARPMSPELVDEMNLEKSMAFYQDRFADASDFTFIFVGNIDLKAMRPLVELYLGALPSVHRKETWKDVGMDSPPGVVKKVVKKGIEPKSQVAVAFTGPFRYDRAHQNAIRALSILLDTRLRNILREDLGGTYGVGVNASYAKIPEEEYTFQLNFGCDPKRVDELVKAVFQEIGNLKAKGPTPKEVSDAREALAREYETGMKQNGYMLSQIYYHYQLHEGLKDLFEYGQSLSQLDSRTIREAARAYLNTGRYVQVTLFPEKE